MCFCTRWSLFWFENVLPEYLIHIQKELYCWKIDENSEDYFVWWLGLMAHQPLMVI